jgi:hypothetical protein
MFTMYFCAMVHYFVIVPSSILQVLPQYMSIVLRSQLQTIPIETISTNHELPYSCLLLYFAAMLWNAPSFFSTLFVM